MNAYPVALDDPAVIARARLPVVYEAACAALQQCADVDECKLWADKMSALQSYARQIDDETLLNFAKRIKGRAVQQMGRILKEIPAANGANQNISTGTHTNVTRTSAADDAGLSKHQKDTALRVAAVPDESFEKQIEGSDVPSITALAEQGTKKAKPPSLEGVDNDVLEIVMPDRIRAKAFIPQHDDHPP